MSYLRGTAKRVTLLKTLFKCPNLEHRELFGIKGTNHYFRVREVNFETGEISKDILPKIFSEVVPREFFHEFVDTKAFKFRNVVVLKEHDGTKDAWIGPQKHVHVWWELANGWAVGWNENPSKGWSFPVKRMRPW